MPVHDRTSFENLDAGQPRWEIGRPQKAILDVADQITGSILDSGCGTGEIALHFAKDGTDDPSPGRFVDVDPKLFNQSEPDEGKRDAQIDALVEWYNENQDKLSWDAKKGKLVVTE